MRYGSLIRYGFKIKNEVNRFFSKHRKTFFICSLFLVFGISMGVFMVVKYSNNIDMNNIYDNNLLLLLKGERGLFGLFFSYLMVFSLVCCVAIFFNWKRWCMFFTFLALTIYGYTIGYNIAIMIVLFGFTGFLNVVLIIIPTEILVCNLLLVVCSIAIYRCYVVQKFGCTYYMRTIYNPIYKIYLWCFWVGCLFIFAKSALMPLIRITIII